MVVALPLHNIRVPCAQADSARLDTKVSQVLRSVASTRAAQQPVSMSQLGAAAMGPAGAGAPAVGAFAPAAGNGRLMAVRAGLAVEAGAFIVIGAAAGAGALAVDAAELRGALVLVAGTATAASLETGPSTG